MNRRTFSASLAGGFLGFWLESEVKSQTCGALPSTSSASAFQIPDNLPVVDRLSVIEMAQPEHANELSRFRQAVQRMQDLTPTTNPLKFANQVNLHCNHCGVAAADIHFNWQFLPWHRAMLFFHERILNKLLPATGGEPPIRVPYWPWDDWNTVANRDVPAIYAAPNQPLSATRNPAGALTQSLVDVQPPLILEDWHDFLGTANSASVNFSGPHANVHNWARAALSSLRFSPVDPLFYAHHANIDRLWSSWIGLGGQRANPDWGQEKAYFFDETGEWRSIGLNDVASETRLGYKYSSLMQLQTAPAPSPLHVTMLSNHISGVDDAASPVKRQRGEHAAAAGTETRSLGERKRFWGVRRCTRRQWIGREPEFRRTILHGGAGPPRAAGRLNRGASGHGSSPVFDRQAEIGDSRSG